MNVALVLIVTLTLVLIVTLALVLIVTLTLTRISSSSSCSIATFCQLNLLRISMG